MQNSAFLTALKFLILIRIHQKRQRDSIDAARRLNHVRNQMLICRNIEIRLLQDGMFVLERSSVFETGFAALRMAREIVIGPVCNPFDLVKLLGLIFPLREDALPTLSERQPPGPSGHLSSEPASMRRLMPVT